MLWTVAALLTLFPGSGALGLWLADTFAPGSWLANVVSFFALPVAFAISLQWWYGLAIVGALARLVIGGRMPRPAASLPGAFVFLPVSSTIGLVAGILVAIVATTSAWVVVATYWAAGTIHGLAGWRLAKAGVLMPPESV